jgi:cbb3-type cytochrome oxidase subunit 1
MAASSKTLTPDTYSSVPIMDWFAKAFVKASVVWLALGVTFGVAMAAHPVWGVYRTAHLHMTLLGFVTMMIYGVAYHVLPRFTGHPLWSRRLGGWHWWLSNAGLTLMVAGFILRIDLAMGAQTATVILTSGGVLSTAGAYAFVLNIWRTIDGPGANAGPGNPLERLSRR